MISREAWYREAIGEKDLGDFIKWDQKDRDDEPLDKSVSHFDHERLKKRAGELLAKFDEALLGLKSGVIIRHLRAESLVKEGHAPDLEDLLYFLEHDHRAAVWPVQKKMGRHRSENLTEEDIRRLEQAYEKFTEIQDHLVLEGDYTSYEGILNWYYDQIYNRAPLEGTPPAMLLDVMRVLRLNKLKLEKAVSESHDLTFPAQRFLQDMSRIWDEGIALGQFFEGVPGYPGTGEHDDVVEPYREQVEGIRDEIRTLLSRIHEAFPEIHLL